MSASGMSNDWICRSPVARTLILPQQAARQGRRFGWSVCDRTGQLNKPNPLRRPSQPRSPSPQCVRLKPGHLMGAGYEASGFRSDYRMAKKSEVQSQIRHRAPSLEPLKARLLSNRRVLLLGVGHGVAANTPCARSHHLILNGLVNCFYAGLKAKASRERGVYMEMPRVFERFGRRLDPFAYQCREFVD
jgi:hypothetical protein